MNKATMHRLKPMLFSQSKLLSNNLALASYLSGILLRIMVFLVMRKSPEKIKKKKKTYRKKTLKSKEKEKRRTRTKSNNNNENIV